MEIERDFGLVAVVVVEDCLDLDFGVALAVVVVAPEQTVVVHPKSTLDLDETEVEFPDEENLDTLQQEEAMAIVVVTLQAVLAIAVQDRLLRAALAALAIGFELQVEPGATH